MDYWGVSRKNWNGGSKEKNDGCPCLFDSAGEVCKSVSKGARMTQEIADEIMGVWHWNMDDGADGADDAVMEAGRMGVWVLLR